MSDDIQARRAALRARFPGWEPVTLSGFLTRSAQKYGDRPFVVTDERTASHAEIDAWATRLADGLAALGAGHPGLADASAVTPDSPGDILYTSGTTGLPKGVVVTHDAVLRTSYAWPPSSSAARPSSAAASLSRMSNPRYSESVVVGRPPEDLYDMVADVTRMGEWSPVCKACWWDDGDGPMPGAWFTGRNELPERTWETRCQVVAADRGREFAFVVGGAWVRWGYTFTPVDGGTQVTESWEFLPDGISRFHDRFGDDAETQIAERTEAARRGIPVTLAAIKQAAEAG